VTFRPERYDTIVIDGTTDASGDAVVRSSKYITGDILSVIVDGRNLTDSANIAVDAELKDADGSAVAGSNILTHGDIGNATLTQFYPSTSLQDTTGTAVASGADEVPTLISLANSKLKVTISGGGNVETFRVWVVVGV
jgi:hypothetical protein